MSAIAVPKPASRSAKDRSVSQPSLAPPVPSNGPRRAPHRGWAGRAAAAATAVVLATAAGGAAAQDEVPFIATPDHVTKAMLTLADVRAGDHVIDLGSGDGRIVITAALHFGATGLGVEIDPDLVRRSQANARTAGVQQRVEFRQQDLFATDLGRATVVTLYLLPDVNLQLRPRLLQLAPGTRIVSHDWDMGDWQPDASVTLAVPEKSIGQDKRSTLWLWRVPAPVHGRWCGPGGFTLWVEQRFQQFSAQLQQAGQIAPAAVFDGRIDATTLQASGTSAATWRWRSGSEGRPPTLELQSGGGPALMTLPRGAFRYTTRAACERDGP